MTLPAKIASDVQKAAPGARVELFEIDTAPIGGTAVYRFTPGTDAGAAVVFNSLTYYPANMTASGWTVSGQGQMPRPVLSIALSATLLAAVLTYDDLVGALVTRRQTFAKYLDGHAEEDPTAEFPEEVYEINKKTEQGRAGITWELRALTDLEGRKLPGRKVIRDWCYLRYRVYASGAFVYTNATCPYQGSGYFDAEGVAATAATDVCGKRLSDCVLRYGTAPLPFGGFPGVARVRS
jgi:lambda family phage minor tail protein L